MTKAATADDIKKAYRKLVRTSHPDLNSDLGWRAWHPAKRTLGSDHGRTGKSLERDLNRT
ncbi:DnaJ domain-containing protein [Yoonia sp.]|uniref:DnaJ domain-containing protein n=1 Tax=Yoonia sp. TaxID=2212373 RepID=UPI002E03C044|nr:DnaJ domain-containing protein [Yoonia sp.]